jgi:tRNA(Ile)-lysidine synthetase-like protein
MNPRVCEALCRTAEALADEHDLVESMVSAAWERMAATAHGRVTLDRAGWAREPAAVQRRLLRRAVGLVQGHVRELGWGHIESARRLAGDDGAGRRVPLPGGAWVTRDHGALVITAGDPELPPPPVQAGVVPLVVPGVTRLPGGWAMSTERRSWEATVLPARDDRWTAVIDADAAGPGPAVRWRRDGDRMRPLGMAGRHKRLQDIFVDGRVPRRERDTWPLIVNGDTILWVPGLRLDRRARVHDGTRAVLVVTALPPGRLVSRATAAD